MEAQIIEEDELQSYIPEGVEICVTTTDLPLMGEQREVEVETSVLEDSFPLGGLEVEDDNGELENTETPISDNTGNLDSPDSPSPSSYPCDKCGLVLSRKSTFDQHMTEVHVDEAYYACEFCPATAIHWSEYYIHQCTNMDNKPLSCPHCHETVSTKKQLSVHEEIHALQRRFTTKKLDNYFKRKLEEAEDQSADWGKMPFICGICGKPFGKLYEVEYHEKLHNEERAPPNRCNLCGLSYLNKNDLNKHAARGCSHEGRRKMTHVPTIT